MAFRFRQRIKIAPGIYINLGKKSASVSVGVKGASITKGIAGDHKGTRANLGLPGTGLNFTQQLEADQTLETMPQEPTKRSNFWIYVFLVLLVFLLVKMLS